MFLYRIVCVAVIVIRSMCQFVGRETSYKYVTPAFCSSCMLYFNMSHVLSECTKYRPRYLKIVWHHMLLQITWQACCPFYWNSSSSYYY